jgi:hypothetical protein
MDKQTRCECCNREIKFPAPIMKLWGYVVCAACAMRGVELAQVSK